MRRPHAVHCLVPPQIFEHILRNGTEEQRAWALDTLLRDQTIRTARIQNAAVRGGGPREGADALAVRAVGRPEDIHPSREIRDAQGREDVHGVVVRREGDEASPDQAVNDAYDALGYTFDFFKDVFVRNSIDDAGMPLRGVVHYGQAYANAFWDGRRMVFGDGDGVVFSSLTGSLDVIAHELGHGVTEDEGALEYFGQAGALNESFSDVWGSLVKQYKLQQAADEADWLIGSDVFSPEIQGDALRSMRAPGTAYDDPTLGRDQQPGHMRDYVTTMTDNGGVHINSGIPNHAFYTVAMTLGGKAWERAGRIWYEALRDPALRPRDDFPTFARITLGAASRLYGVGSEEARAVRDGWETVGVKPAR